jgi:hypothetical protein
MFNSFSFLDSGFQVQRLLASNRCQFSGVSFSDDSGQTTRDRKLKAEDETSYLSSVFCHLSSESTPCPAALKASIAFARSFSLTMK